MSAGLLLDTVVVSELRKGSRADPAVKVWQESVRNVPAYISVITLLEIQSGFRRVARRDPAFGAKLKTWYHEYLLPGFKDRVLSVDLAVIEATAELASSRTLPVYDALIAGTARVHDLTIATRNIFDFADTGAELINPWTAFGVA